MGLLRMPTSHCDKVATSEHKAWHEFCSGVFKVYKTTTVLPIYTVKVAVAVPVHRVVGAGRLPTYDDRDKLPCPRR